jgi:hypothetical protein
MSRVPLISKIPKDFFAMVGISFLAAAMFMFYLHLIGIPTTRARNKYNRAVNLYELGRVEEAKIRLQESLKLWPSSEVQGFYDKISQE